MAGNTGVRAGVKREGVGRLGQAVRHPEAKDVVISLRAWDAIQGWMGGWVCHTRLQTTTCHTPQHTTVHNA